MKNILLLGISALFSLSGMVNAQETASSRLIINIQPIQSISINEDQQHISLEMNTVESYMEGNENLQTDHVEVISNMKYEVRVMAMDHLKSVNDMIDIGLIEVTPSCGTVGTSDKRLSLSSVSLSRQERQVIVSPVGELERAFSMNYKLSSSDQWLNKETGNYTALIIYTLLSF